MVGNNTRLLVVDKRRAVIYNNIRGSWEFVVGAGSSEITLVA